MNADGIIKGKNADGDTWLTKPNGNASVYGTDYNDGWGMWNKLIKEHDNIVLVLSGHIDEDDVHAKYINRATGQEVAEKSEDTFTSILINPQELDNTITNGTGMVAMLHFSDGGSKITLEYYSTVRNQWFKTNNQNQEILLNVK